MSLRPPAPTFTQQVMDLVAGRASHMRINEYYSAKNSGGAIQIHSTAPGALDNEFLGILMSEVTSLSKFFDVLLTTRSSVTDVMNDTEKADTFVSELKELQPKQPRRAVKTSGKSGTGVSQ